MSDADRNDVSQYWPMRWGTALLMGGLCFLLLKYADIFTLTDETAIVISLLVVFVGLVFGRRIMDMILNIFSLM